MFFIFGIFVPLGLQVITVGLHRPPTWLAVLITEQGIFGAAGALAAGPAPQAIGNLAGAGLVLALPYRALAYLVAGVIALTALYLGTRTAGWTTSASAN